MDYLLLICSDGNSTAEQSAVMRESTPGWVQEMDGRGIRHIGQGLEGPHSAKTVRVRDGQTLVTDGPFAEAKEFVAGFDIITAENLDEAIEVAAKHPVSWFHSVEVRPFLDRPALPDYEPDPFPAQGTEDTLKYMLSMFVDGVPESDEVEAKIAGDMMAWADEVKAAGNYIYGAPLAHADTAVTVRVRDGETLLTDGPFIESKEFMAGFVLLSCDSEQEALEAASRNPLAAFHMVEVQPFWRG